MGIELSPRQTCHNSETGGSGDVGVLQNCAWREGVDDELLERSGVLVDSREMRRAACEGYTENFTRSRGRRKKFPAFANPLAGVVFVMLMMVALEPCLSVPITSGLGEGSSVAVASGDMVLPVQVTNTTPAPDTTPVPEVVCPSPPDGPCPANQHIFLQPQRGPNRNYQQMGQIVTVSGVFFPEDCSKGCLFNPPCETCEMEVTYFVYFGTADAGCNFDDTAASACQCTPLSGQVKLLSQARIPFQNSRHPFFPLAVNPLLEATTP